MKTGMTLMELAAELERQEETKRDFIADTRQVSLQTERTEDGFSQPYMRINGVAGCERLQMQEMAHKQVAQRLKIPKQHYDRILADYPDLLALTVNRLFNEEPERRMVRTLDGNARAFLSDRYRKLDNLDLTNAVIPVLQEQKDLQIVSSQITETRFYLKALFPRTQGEVKVGDVVQFGLCITNSETGLGALRIEPLLYRLRCLNGMVTSIGLGGSRRAHLGRRAADEENAFEIYRDETLAADDKALWMKIQDNIRHLAHPDNLEQILVEWRKTTTREITGNPVAAVEVARKRFGYTEELGASILRNLINDAGINGLTQFGLSNAITRAAQDVSSYDLASELERDGGRIIELPKAAWEEIALAA